MLGVAGVSLKHHTRLTRLYTSFQAFKLIHKELSVERILSSLPESISSEIVHAHDTLCHFWAHLGQYQSNKADLFFHVLNFREHSTRFITVRKII